MIERGTDNVVGAPGSLHPASKALIDSLAGLPPIETLTPEQARTMPLVFAGAPEPVGSVTQQWIDGPGGRLPIRIYRPSGVARPPAFVYMHGGGWVIGSIENTDALCRRLTNATGCAILSVGYRLAPEDKYPAALDDTMAAIAWTVRTADALDIDAGRLVVGGNSAGGNLAAAACLAARDRGGPKIALQVLLVPALWLTDVPTESMRRNAKGYGLDATEMRWFALHYVRTEADANDPLASPYVAADHRGLPPALIVTAEFDPLCDDGELYAKKLRAAGVETTVIRYAGMTHAVLATPGLEQRIREIGAVVRSYVGEVASTSAL